MSSLFLDSDAATDLFSFVITLNIYMLTVLIALK